MQVAEPHVAVDLTKKQIEDSPALSADKPDAPLTTVTEATRFTGKLTYRFAPMQGSECSDQTLDQGGDFAALPCEVSYDLSAAQTKKPQP